jgi:hypothetical protein
MKAGTDLQRYIDLLIPHPSKEWTYAHLYIVCLGGGGADNYRDPGPPILQRMDPALLLFNGGQGGVLGFILVCCMEHFFGEMQNMSVREPESSIIYSQPWLVIRTCSLFTG